MEISNYRVRILGGKHISDPNRDTNLTKPWSYTSLFSGFSPWSNIHDLESYDNSKSYVEMKDGDNYVISLTNGKETKCHAKITIDGKPVGTWILEPFSGARIERPVDVAKKFTFFKVNSRGGVEAGLITGDTHNGLITVEFIPERANLRENASFDTDYDHVQNQNALLGFGLGQGLGLGRGGQGLRAGKRLGPARSAQFSSGHSSKSLFTHSNFIGGRESYEAGGTGLKGRSEQNFRVSNEPLDLDHNAKVTINLRLIARKDPIDYDRVTPLGGVRSNPIPPPL